MAQKVYYDTVNNKEVVDVSGVKTGIVAEFGLDNSTQEITLTNDDAYAYVDNGTLMKKTKAQDEAEKEAAKAAKDADKATKKTSVQAALGLTDTQWDELVAALS